MSEFAYDTMQVCLNGDCINASYRHDPQGNKAFCRDCGERTITNCTTCNMSLKGDLLDLPTCTKCPVPLFCEACGMTYPWQIARGASAIEDFACRA